MSQRHIARFSAGLALTLQMPGVVLGQSAAPAASTAQPTPAPSATAPAPSASTPAPAESAPAAAPPAPIAPTPPPAPPPPAPAAAPATAPPASPDKPAAVPNDDDLSFAVVHIASDYRCTWLELRDFVDSGDWLRVCQAPCDRKLR